MRSHTLFLTLVFFPAFFPRLTLALVVTFVSLDFFPRLAGLKWALAMSAEACPVHG